MGVSMSAAMAALFALLLHNKTVVGCTIQNGTRYDGAALTTLTAIASQDVCCFECRANPNCYAFTFYVNGTANANKCVLRSSNWTVASDSTAVSGIATGKCAFEDGIEYPLFTSQVVTDISNKETCCNWCSTTLKCAAFTYFKLTKQCVLKYAVSNRIPSPNFSSGTVDTGTCSYEDGFKYSGFDMKSISTVPSKAACCASCQGTAGCAAFSYANSGPQAKTCTLKSSAVNKRANSNAVSSRVTGLSCVDSPKLVGK